MYYSKKLFLSRMLFSIVLVLFVFSASAEAMGENKNGLRFNSEYKLKKSSITVTVFYINEDGEKVEYSFGDFNADVLLYVYRRIDQKRIISALADKYGISETESRRKVKIALNRMEVWSIIERT